MKESAAEKNIESEKNEPTDKQMFSALLFCVMLVLVGIPLWWKTTEVYRVSLPYSEIDKLDEINVQIQMNIHIVTIENHHGVALMNELKNLYRTSNLYKIQFKQHSFDRAIVGSCKSLEEIDEKIKHPNFEGSLQLIEIPGLSRFTPSSIIFGENRTLYFSSNTDGIKLYNFLNRRVLNEDHLLSTISQVNFLKKNNVNKYSKHKMPPSDDFDILFTILNSDPDLLDVKFDVSSAIADYVNPFIRDLEDMNGFHVKSQWLYFVNLQVQPKFVNNTERGAHFALSEELLPHVLTPLEKKLASHVSIHPCLNFVLYIPPCSVSPLQIYTKRGFPVEGKNAFISPRWGGIQIYNPDRKSCVGTNKVTVEPEKHEIMSIFVKQLKLLLGLSELSGAEKDEVMSTGVHLQLWQKDLLLRLRTVEQLTSAKLTIQSLSKLLGKISNIVINDQVGEAICSALDNIQKATEALAKGKLPQAYRNSKSAFLSSERAFTDPSLLALLYFPDDQKYAVYIPLFLPIMIPILISFKHIKQWAGRKFRVSAKLKDN